MDFPTIQVTTQLPGASPDIVANLITASLERQFGQIQGLTTMTSTSSEGTSQITLQFELTRNIDAAAQDVQAAINAAAGTLPGTLPYPPVYAKVNPADAPILTLALTSDTLSTAGFEDTFIVDGAPTIQRQPRSRSVSVRQNMGTRRIRRPRLRLEGTERARTVDMRVDE